MDIPAICDEDGVSAAKWHCGQCRAYLCDACDTKVHTAARILAVGTVMRTGDGMGLGWGWGWAGLGLAGLGWARL